MPFTLPRDLRSATTYHEVEALLRSMREPGVGRIVDATDLECRRDGAVVAFTAWRRTDVASEPSPTIGLLDVETGTLQLLDDPEEGCSRRWPRWSADSGRLLCLRRTADGSDEPTVLDVDTGSSSRVSTDACRGQVESLAWSPDGQAVALLVAEPGAEISDVFGSGRVTGADQVLIPIDGGPERSLLRTHAQLAGPAADVEGHRVSVIVGTASDRGLVAGDHLQVVDAGTGSSVTPVEPADLDRLFEMVRWDRSRPGFIPVFYDGYLNNATVAAPVCDELGITAWFFPPTAFLSVAPAEQAGYADAHDITLVDEERDQPSLAMSWEDLEAISRRHVVAAHTANHSQARHIVTVEDVEREVLEPVRRIEEVTGTRPPAFAWLYGTPFDPSSVAGRAVLDAGIRYAVSNTAYQRIAD